MRIRYGLWSLGVAAGLVLCTVARADAPADLGGQVLQASGHIRVGGNVDFLGLQDFEYDFAGLRITISDIDGDPTQIQIDTVLPAPDVPCNRGRDFSISLTGAYDPATGAVQVIGVRPGVNRVDTGPLRGCATRGWTLSVLPVAPSVVGWAVRNSARRQGSLRRGKPGRALASCAPFCTRIIRDGRLR